MLPIKGRANSQGLARVCPARFTSLMMPIRAFEMKYMQHMCSPKPYSNS